MRTMKRFLGIVLTLASLVLAPFKLVQGAATASDNACSAGYSGSGDWTGNNGGNGFSAWSGKIVSGGGLFKRASSGINDNNSGAATIDTSCSGSFSWGMNAGGNAGNTAQVTRAFTQGSTASSALLVGHVFSIDMDNGYVDNSPNPAGFSLQNSSGNDVFSFTAIAGASYRTNNATSTIVGYTGHGLRIIFTLLTSSTYKLQVITPITSTTTNTYNNQNLLNPTGGQAIDRVSLYGRATGGGTATENSHDLYFNSMSISCSTFTATVANANACTGSTAYFTVTAAGATTPTYQWQVSTDNGGTWNPVTGGSGASTATYTTPTLTAGDDGNRYRTVVTDTCGTVVNSTAGLLSIATGVNITTQPSSTAACSGSSVSFAVVASGATGYQWYKGPNGSGTALSNGGAISGATSATLTYSAIAGGDDGANYYVVVNGCVSSVTSGSAVLTVSTAPSIGTQPTAQATCAGGNATFSVAANGLPLNYAWRKRGTGWGANTWALTAGGSLFVGSSTGNGGGAGSTNIDTSGQAWGMVNSNSSSVTTAIRAFPAALQPGQQFQIDMDNGFIDAPGTIGFSLLNAAGNIVWELYIGGNTNYRIHDNSSTNLAVGAGYTETGVRVSFTLTSTTTYSATVQVLSSGATFGPITGTLLNPTGGSVPSKVRLYDAAGNGGNQFRVYFNNIIVAGVADDNAAAYTGATWAGGQTPNLGNSPLSNVGTVSGSTTASLTLSGVTIGDNGASFDVVITNSCGYVQSSTVGLSLTAAPPINSQPQAASVCVGATAQFTVSASNVAIYQWQVSIDNGNNWNNVSGGSGATAATYTTPTLAAGDNGKQYRVVLTDACANAVNGAAASLTVIVTPSIAIQPTAQIGFAGASANFTVGATGTGFQWYKGPTGSGVALSDAGSVSGATTATLTLSGLAIGDNGANFYIVVSGCGGSPVTSAGAILTVTVGNLDPRLKANGLTVRNGNGTGDIVPLRGVNLGGWLVFESWMCPMDSSGLADTYSVIQKLDTRFNSTIEQSLLRTYQNTWITAGDLDNIRAMGMNVIRVPFWWANLQQLDGTWRSDAYDKLDWVVSNAWQRGIYTIVDLHGVYGGQSTGDHTGRADQNQYWTSSSNQNQTAMLWSNVAAHFVGNPAVAAYDLINEPYGAPTRDAIWLAYSNLYQVVRAVDPDHIIIMEATWKGTAGTQQLNWVWDVLPPPTLYGWSNVVYSLHEYHFEDTASIAAVETGMVNQVIDFRNHQSWNVPVLIGEFNMFSPGANPGAVWKYGIQLLNSNNMNWTVWAYKAIHGSATNNPPDSWGLYDFVGNVPPSPNIQADSPPVISNIWSQCDTASHFAINPFLKASLAGPLAVPDLYAVTAGTTLSVNSGLGVLSNDIDINLGQPGIQLAAILIDSPMHGVLNLNANGSFSYTPDSGYTGTDAFRYRVNDGYADSVNIATVAIQVNSASPPVSAFEQWQVQYFGCTNCPEAQASADPLGKGMSNTNQFLAGLNPNDPSSVFRIISVAPQGPNLVITWKTAGVRTNAVQANPGNNYGTNGFTDVAGSPIVINISGDTTTNYVDSGGATNRPARYYRIRLVP